MAGIQSRIARHSKYNENVTHNEENNQLIEPDSELT